MYCRALICLNGNFLYNSENSLLMCWFKFAFSSFSSFRSKVATSQKDIIDRLER